MRKGLSIVIPAFNEGPSVLEVIKQCTHLPIPTEVIVVNDGSSDGTREILDSARRKYNNLVIVHREKNGGKGRALRDGFKKATMEYTVVQDADLEYYPSDLVKMYKLAKDKDLDVIYGNRFAKQRWFKGMDWKNFLGNNIILPIMASILYGQVINDESTCYKMFKTDLLKSIPLKCERFEFCPEITAKVRKRGYKIHEVPIDYKPRTMGGGKKLKALKDGSEAVWTLLKYRFVD